MRYDKTTCPIASCKSICQKWQSGKQNKTLTCPAQQVMFWAESLQCNSPLFNRVAGQVEGPTGQVSFRGSLPRSARNILESMLHPDEIIKIINIIVLVAITMLIFTISTRSSNRDTKGNILLILITLLTLFGIMLVLEFGISFFVTFSAILRLICD